MRQWRLAIDALCFRQPPIWPRESLLVFLYNPCAGNPSEIETFWVPWLPNPCWMYQILQVSLQWLGMPLSSLSSVGKPRHETPLTNTHVLGLSVMFQTFSPQSYQGFLRAPRSGETTWWLCLNVQLTGSYQWVMGHILNRSYMFPDMVTHNQNTETRHRKVG